MSKESTTKNSNPLSSYGEFISSYNGNGYLTIVNGQGERKIGCRFEAGQLINGSVLLLCHDLPRLLPLELFCGSNLKKFEGHTNEGYLIKSNTPKKSLVQIEYLPETHKDSQSADLAVRLNELSIELTKDDPTEIRFGIANCKIDDINPAQNLPRSPIVILTQKDGSQIEISIKGLRDYESRITRISTLRTIDITCEVILKFSIRTNINELIETVNDICHILSLKNGTKIVWIYFELMNKNGMCIFRKHSSNVTKPCQSLDIFYLNRQYEVRTKEFLEQTYPHYIKYRDLLKLNRGVIDAYLDAKAERDYLETRGGKIAVAIEKLKYEYLKSKGRDAEFVIPKKDFNQYVNFLSGKVAEILEKQSIDDKNKIQSISSEGKIEGLNRRSFSSILKQFSKDFHLKFTKDEVSLFVQCRNSLVHRGDFYCNTADDDESKKCPPLPSNLYEFFFLVNMLDRIFLKILGFDDNPIKIDWRNPPEHIVNWLK